jgi:hypothetical protein
MGGYWSFSHERTHLRQAISGLLSSLDALFLWLISFICFNSFVSIIGTRGDAAVLGIFPVASHFTRT